MTRRMDRAYALRAHYFLPLEARELSVLPRKTPARVAMVQARDLRRARWERIASGKIASGAWRRSQLQQKWLMNLSRMYTKRNWRVKIGAAGRQQSLPKGSPNPWEMYRFYVKDTGGDNAQGWVSPWRVRLVHHGKAKLDKGLLAAAVGGRTVSKAQIKVWLTEKEKAISRSRSPKRRAELRAQYRRLEKLI